MGCIRNASNLQQSFGTALWRGAQEKKEVPKGWFGQHTITRIRHHFSDLSADVQKFLLPARRVRESNPTAVGSSGILSMSIYVHVGKTGVTDYDYKDLDKDTCP